MLFYFGDRRINASMELRGDRIGGVGNVCQAWRLPAQRYFFVDVVVTRLIDLITFTKIVTENPHLGQFVKFFYVAFLAENVSKDHWTVKQLTNALKALPNLTALDIDLNSFSPGHFADFSPLTEIKQLSSVSQVSIRTQFFQRDFRQLRPILAATPNINLLSLRDFKDEDEQPLGSPHPLKKQPLLDFPRLTHLYLNSQRLCMDLPTWRLLSPATLQQVTDLRIDFEPTEPYPLPKDIPAPPFGPNIKILRLGESLSTFAVSRLVTACPNLEYFITSSPFRQLVLPDSLHTIKFIVPDDPNTDPEWLMYEGRYGPVVTWNNVKRFELDGIEPPEEGMEFFRERGIEVAVVNFTPLDEDDEEEGWTDEDESMLSADYRPMMFLGRHVFQ